MTNTPNEWINEGNRKLDSRMYEDAIVEYDKVIAQNLSDNLTALAWLNKGVALSNNEPKRWDEALLADEKCIKLYDDGNLKKDANYATAWLNKGIAFGNIIPNRW
jgi:tetratricopeptide (TPR) repeat protein